jgi:hypothetical protein
MLLTMATTNPRTNNLLSLLTNWHVHKRETTFLKRLGMRGLEVVALATAMLIVPTIIHQGVRSVDELYELLGRRARSPYTGVSWIGVVVAVVLMLGWHVWLGRLSFRIILEPLRTSKADDNASNDMPEQRDVRGQEERISWGRVLGRIIIPSLLSLLGTQYAWKIGQRVVTPKEMVVRNTVDMQEAVGQLYGLQ